MKVNADQLKDFLIYLIKKKGRLIYDFDYWEDMPHIEGDHVPRSGYFVLFYTVKDAYQHLPEESIMANMVDREEVFFIEMPKITNINKKHAH